MRKVILFLAVFVSIFIYSSCPAYAGQDIYLLIDKSKSMTTADQENVSEKVLFSFLDQITCEDEFRIGIFFYTTEISDKSIELAAATQTHVDAIKGSLHKEPSGLYTDTGLALTEIHNRIEDQKKSGNENEPHIIIFTDGEIDLPPVRPRSIADSENDVKNMLYGCTYPVNIIFLDSEINESKVNSLFIDILSSTSAVNLYTINYDGQGIESQLTNSFTDIWQRLNEKDFTILFEIDDLDGKAVSSDGLVMGETYVFLSALSFNGQYYSGSEYPVAFSAGDIPITNVQVGSNGIYAASYTFEEAGNKQIIITYQTPDGKAYDMSYQVNITDTTNATNTTNTTNTTNATNATNDTNATNTVNLPSNEIMVEPSIWESKFMIFLSPVLTVIVINILFRIVKRLTKHKMGKEHKTTTESDESGLAVKIILLDMYSMPAYEQNINVKKDERIDLGNIVMHKKGASLKFKDIDQIYLKRRKDDSFYIWNGSKEYQILELSDTGKENKLKGKQIQMELRKDYFVKSDDIQSAVIKIVFVH